jgi:hypothetical protein
MDDLIKKIDEVLRGNLAGATTELELLPPLSKVSGFILWDGFEGNDDMDRQNRVWDLLQTNLTPEERRRVSAIFTLTPHENAIIRQHEPA